PWCSCSRCGIGAAVDHEPFGAAPARTMRAARNVRMSRSMRVSAFNLSVTVLLVTIAFVACAKDAARQAASKTTASIDTAAAAQTAATPTGTARASSLVGLAYTTLPSGLTFVSGAAIPSASGSASFDLAQVKTPDGDRLLLQTTGPTIAGAPSHLVVADLKLPPVGPG